LLAVQEVQCWQRFNTESGSSNFAMQETPANSMEDATDGMNP